LPASSGGEWLAIGSNSGAILASSTCVTAQTGRRKDRLASLRLFFESLGPGLITGAADDDPSGISTYSVAGASLGYLPLWTALFSFPLMVATQLMCARLGMVTGLGLAAVIRRRYSPVVLWGACALLCVANTINIAADLAGMAEATQLVTGLPTAIGVATFAVVLTMTLIWTSYRTIARFFKWLTLVLGAYLATAFFAPVDWRAVALATLLPRIEPTRAFFSVLVGILGTTISPYLFFWQAAQEVEEERAMGRRTLAQRKGASAAELRNARVDVMTGMVASNAVMYFIILTTAATLHARGVTNITTAREAAEALRPLAGQSAYWLFTLGIIGTGVLAVPVLAGSCAYAIAEAAAWRQGSLAAHPGRARKFYGVMAVAMLVGLTLDYAGFNAIRLLFVSAVINGLLAPPLVLLILLLTRDRKVMGTAVNSRLLDCLGWTTFLVMTGAALGLLL
jgi:NRAMP (natural resistance-associated macrophage protein)-like metal ion transporter